MAIELQSDSLIFDSLEVSEPTFELRTNVIDWTEWNKDAESSLNYWANKYDRGECLDPSPGPCSTPTTGTTGTTGTSGEPEPPTVYYCPKIEDFLMYPCSQVKMFIKGSKDAIR